VHRAATSAAAGTPVCAGGRRGGGPSAILRGRSWARAVDRVARPLLS